MNETTAFDVLIDGRWRGAGSGRRFERRNPADTSDMVGAFPECEADDAYEATESARRATVGWRALGSIARGRILLDAAALLRGRAESVARDIVRENGKTVAEARGEVGVGIAFLEYFGGLGRAAYGELQPDARPGVHGWTSSEPLGVVALITPWNDPFVTPLRKLAPALVAGNTVVIKPSSLTPLGTLHALRALHDAGIPSGVVNVVTGEVSELSPVLLDAARIDAVSFTGSTAVGRSIERTLGGTTTRVQAEMGGKNAVLVMPDADLDLACSTILSCALGQSGQRCTAASRVVVHAEVADEVIGRLSVAFSGVRVGSGLDPETQMGPLVSHHHLAEVCTALDSAREDGQAVNGGVIPDRPGLEGGHFLSPALVTHADHGSSLWRDEVFGPVVVTSIASSLDDGIAQVNDSPYGLSAAIFTRSLDPAFRFAEGVSTGQVAVNLPTTGWDVHVPFGGFGESGSAFKEHGRDALRFFTRTKSVMMRV